MKPFEKCKQILNQRYVLEKNSYLTSGEILEELSKHVQSIQVRNGKTTSEFLLCGNHALYTKVVAYHRKYHISANQLDVMKICTTIKASKGHIQAFFNKPEHRNYILGVNIGNLQHDMAIFIKKEPKNDYTFIHFDPNTGVSSQITNAFTKQFGKNTRRFGYHHSQGNIQGKCTLLTWMELLSFLLKAENPFKRLDLKQYCPTTKTYVTTEEFLEVTAKIKRQNQVYNATRREKKRKAVQAKTP